MNRSDGSLGSTNKEEVSDDESVGCTVQLINASLTMTFPDAFVVTSRDLTELKGKSKILDRENLKRMIFAQFCFTFRVLRQSDFNSNSFGPYIKPSQPLALKLTLSLALNLKLSPTLTLTLNPPLTLI